MLFRALALRWGHLTLGQLMKFPHSLMSDSPLLLSTIARMGELVMKHVLTHSSSQQKPQKQQKVALCYTIGCPSMSRSSVDGWPCSDPQPVHLNPSDKPDWRVSQRLPFTSLGFREISGQSLLIYVPKNFLHSYLKKLWRKKTSKASIKMHAFLKIKMTGMCMWPRPPHLLSPAFLVHFYC